MHDTPTTKGLMYAITIVHAGMAVAEYALVDC